MFHNCSYSLFLPQFGGVCRSVSTLLSLSEVLRCSTSYQRSLPSALQSESREGSPQTPKPLEISHSTSPAKTNTLGLHCAKIQIFLQIRTPSRARPPEPVCFCCRVQDKHDSGQREGSRTCLWTVNCWNLSALSPTAKWKRTPHLRKSLGWPRTQHHLIFPKISTTIPKANPHWKTFSGTSGARLTLQTKYQVNRSM